MPHEPVRIVADTNLLVSRLLLPQSLPAMAVRKAVEEAQLLVSDATLEELAEVLSRPKFDPYVTLEERQQFIRVLNRIAERVIVTSPVQACRDPRDDKFLEVALNGDADLIVTGDRDLLALHPYRGVDILAPREYIGMKPRS
jgi:putative PIN family toxin of toxin-antitoxin system